MTQIYFILEIFFLCLFSLRTFLDIFSIIFSKQFFSLSPLVSQAPGTLTLGSKNQNRNDISNEMTIQFILN